MLMSNTKQVNLLVLFSACKYCDYWQMVNACEELLVNSKYLQVNLVVLMSTVITDE